MDRARGGSGSAVCRFCDTDFVGTDGTLGGKYATAAELADRVASLWPTTDSQHQLVVMTGWERLLQADSALIATIQARGFRIAVETDGTLVAPSGIDWICVSPKAGAQLVQMRGHELKLIYPQAGLLPHDLPFSALHFDHYLLQPMDGPAILANTTYAIEHCRANPRWRLSMQTHKVLQIRKCPLCGRNAPRSASMIIQ